jgi:alkylhydroperoxidase family enzyme
MAFIRQIAEQDATGPLKRVYDAATGREGTVAGIVKVMGLDAPILQASMQVYMSIMKRENALNAAQREMLAAVVSNVNDCYY